MAKFEVEAILDKKMNRTTKISTYLVKWKQYNYLECTWQPYEHLRDQCLDLLQKFQDKYGKLATTETGKVGIPTRKQLDKELALLNKKSQLKSKPKAKTVAKKNKQPLRPTHPKQTTARRKGTTFIQKAVPKTKNIRKQIKKARNPKQIYESSQSQQPMQAVSSESEQLIQQVPPQHSVQQLFEAEAEQAEEEKLDIRGQIYESDQEKIDNSRLVNIQNNRAKIVVKRHSSQNEINLIDSAQPQSEQLREQKNPTNINNFNQNKNRAAKFKITINDFSIIGLRRSGDTYNYLVIKDGMQMWMPRSQVYEEYPRILCNFYEKHLSFK